MLPGAVPIRAAIMRRHHRVLIITVQLSVVMILGGYRGAPVGGAPVAIRDGIYAVLRI